MKKPTLPLPRSKYPNKSTVTVEELNRLVDETGASIAKIERGVGMPLYTLQKILRGKPDTTGYVRQLPKKWEAKLLRYIRNYKEEKQEIKQILIEKGIEVVTIVPEIAQPDIEGKKEWIDVLVKAKEDYEPLRKAHLL